MEYKGSLVGLGVLGRPRGSLSAVVADKDGAVARAGVGLLCHLRFVSRTSIVLRIAINLSVVGWVADPAILS